MTLDDLKFVRLTQPSQFGLIPPYLFEQMKDSDINPERIYQFGPLMLASPLTFFYALADKKTHIVKGVLWIDINPFEDTFYVEVFSVDREYQQKHISQNGDSTLSKALAFIKSIPEYKELQPKIVMTTTRPKAFEKAGWERSKKVRLEI